ncbi:MAG: hypothetical protein WCE75_11690 [Terracidiphilus sp.]
MGDQIGDTAHKASRAASAVADALENGGEAARCAGKQSSQAASELYCDTRKRLQRYPFESVTATFAVGIAAGAVIGWMLGRR